MLGFHRYLQKKNIHNCGDLFESSPPPISFDCLNAFYHFLFALNICQIFGIWVDAYIKHRLSAVLNLQQHFAIKTLNKSCTFTVKCNTYSRKAKSTRWNNSITWQACISPSSMINYSKYNKNEEYVYNIFIIHVCSIYYILKRCTLWKKDIKKQTASSN